LDEFYRFGRLERESGLMHLVTTKDTAMACSFSLALHTGENPALIRANREHIGKHFGDEREWSFIVANQTHSANITHITAHGSQGWEGEQSAIADCDALITDIPGVVLTILTADCVPILLYDRKHHAIGAIHAGWRGVHGGIVPATVAMMQEKFGTDAGELIAAIGPAIGGCCYEVGEDVAGNFRKHPAALSPSGNEGKSYLDLPKVVREQLVAAGISEENIESSGVCTACEVERFFSYRQEGGCSGRFMSMISLV